MAYASILNLQNLSEECDKNNENTRQNITHVTKSVTKSVTESDKETITTVIMTITMTTMEKSVTHVTKSVTKSVKQFFNLVNQVEKELNFTKSKLPITLTKLANASERKTIDILTGQSTSEFYKGPIFALTDIYQPHAVMYKYQNETKTYNPDFLIGNLVIEVKCCKTFLHGGKIKVKHETISKTQPFQVWLFDKDQGDLIDILTYINGIPYHSNGHQLSTFKGIKTPEKWKEWISKIPPLEKAKNLQDFFHQHTKIN